MRLRRRPAQPPNPRLHLWPVTYKAAATGAEQWAWTAAQAAIAEQHGRAGDLAQVSLAYSHLAELHLRAQTGTKIAELLGEIGELPAAARLDTQAGRRVAEEALELSDTVRRLAKEGEETEVADG